MMRWLVIGLLVVAGLLFLVSFGGGMGYASGGGAVQIFPKWSEAHSESGQAVAVYGDVENFEADNTPHSSDRPLTRNSPIDMFIAGVLFVFILILVVVFVAASFVAERVGWDEGAGWSFGNNAPGTNYEHYSAKEAQEWERHYGPVGGEDNE